MGQDSSKPRPFPPPFQPPGPDNDKAQERGRRQRGEKCNVDMDCFDKSLKCITGVCDYEMAQNRGSKQEGEKCNVDMDCINDKLKCITGVCAYEKSQSDNRDETYCATPNTK